MSKPDSRVETFIGRHHVMTLATTDGETIHCSNLFYAYECGENSASESACITSAESAAAGGRFVVVSSLETLHGRQAALNENIAASIVLETGVVGKLQGLQIRGRMYRPEGKELAGAKKVYLGRFPFAVVMELELWVIEPMFMKFTDNRLGFGKKIVWEKQ